MVSKGKNKKETLKSHTHLDFYSEFVPLVHLCLRAGALRLALVGSPSSNIWALALWVSNCFEVKGQRTRVPLAFLGAGRRSGEAALGHGKGEE